MCHYYVDVFVAWTLEIVTGSNFVRGGLEKHRGGPSHLSYSQYCP